MTAHEAITSALITIKFDLFKLSGKFHQKYRQQLMTLIVGEKRPKAKCGVNHLTEELFKYIKVDQTTLARCEYQDTLEEKFTGCVK